MLLERIARLRSSTRMLTLALIAVASILLTTGTTVSSKMTFAEIEERSEASENSDVHYEDAKREKRETEGQPEEEALYPSHRESSADELAAAVGPQNVGYQNSGNYMNKHPRQAVADGWRDAVPGTPGMDYPNLDGIPVTSFTCTDKQPGGYYADVETGCQVFHVCNTGGVKSSFLCPAGNIFSQRYLVCDWWYGVNCQEAVDLYFKKPEADFSDLSEDSVGSIVKNYGNATDVTEASSSFPGKYSQESRVQNGANPSLMGNGQGTIASSSPTQRSEDINEPFHYENNLHDYSSDLKNLESLDNGATDNNLPRGFSLNDNASFKRRTFHHPMTPHELTNDLASYVNYAYFQAELNDNINHNDGDDDQDDYDYHGTQDNSDERNLEDNSKSKTIFGDKLTYEKGPTNGYPVKKDSPRIRGSKGIDAYA